MNDWYFDLIFVIDSKHLYIRMSERTLSEENEVEKSGLIKSSSKTKIYLFELEECKVKDERLRLFMRSIL